MDRPRTHLAVAALCACVSWPLTGAVLAQSYPARAIRIVVPFAPGGGADTNARIVGPKLGELLQVAVIVDNRPGGGSILGSEIVAKSAPDGYTLLLGSSEFTVNPSLHAKLPYDALKDFAPVAQTVSSQYVLSTHPSVPVSTVKQLIALAKEQPGQLNYGSAGIGSASHLAGEMLQAMTGTKLVHIPFKGAGPATIALVGGELGFMFSSTTAAVAHIKSRRLRALAVTGPARFHELPEIPTVAEAGVTGFVITGWFGFLAPAATPREIVARLGAEIAKTTREPAVRERFASLGTVPVESSPEAFGVFLRSEMAKWARVVKASGARPD